MKNFDDFSKEIKINESEIRFLNENELDLDELGSILKTYAEDQGNDNITYSVDGETLTIEMGGKILIKKHGDGYIVSMEHNEDEEVKDIHSWFSSQLASHASGEAEHKMEESKSIFTDAEQQAINDMATEWLKKGNDDIKDQEDADAMADKFYKEHNDEKYWTGIVPKNKMEDALQHAKDFISDLNAYGIEAYDND